MPGQLGAGAWDDQHPTFKPLDIPLPDLLAFAASKHAGQDWAVRKRFGISRLRYVQALLRAIDTPEAEAINPVLVARLRAERDERRAKRERATTTPLGVRCFCGHRFKLRPWEAAGTMKCPNCGAEVYGRPQDKSLRDVRVKGVQGEH